MYLLRDLSGKLFNLFSFSRFCILKQNNFMWSGSLSAILGSWGSKPSRRRAKGCGDIICSSFARTIIEVPSRECCLTYNTRPASPVDLNPEIPLDEETQQWLDQYIPSVEEVAIGDLAKIPFAMAVLGLGFEDRTLASAKRLFRVVSPVNLRSSATISGFRLCPSPRSFSSRLAT